MSEEVLTTLKLIVVGSAGVGKTCIISRLVNRDFVIHMPTLRPEPYVKKYHINGNTVKCALWDTAGQERFNAVPSMFYRDVHGAVLVYDVTDYKSFKDIDKWLVDLKNYYDGLDKQPIITLLGNKIDMEGREVQRREGVILAKKHAALFLETSAQTGECVDNAFEDLVAKILDTPGLWKRNEEFKSLSLEPIGSSDQNTWLRSCSGC